MKTYIVTVREVWTQMVKVTVDGDEDIAKQAVRDGKGEYMDDTNEYSHNMDPDTWTVEEVNDE